MKRIGLGIAAFILASLAVLGVFVYGQLNGWFTREYTLPELVEVLKPSIEEVRAEGEGKSPAVLLFPGCGGSHAFHKDYASLAVEEGYSAFIVNSFGARGLNNSQAQMRVCTGQILWGRERAGDVAAAIYYVRSLPHIDPDRIVLMGWSHGAWSIMDLLAMDFSHYYPTNLEDPPGPEIRGAIEANILFYPYCGMLSLSPSFGWERPVHSLLLIAGKDRVVNSGQCLRLADDLKEDGVALDLHVYPGADHAFDQPNRIARYQADLAKDANDRVRSFLRALKAQASDQETND